MSEVRSQKSEVREEKPPISPKGDELPSGFFRFWEIYPRKVAKAAALKSWKRLRCEPISEKIIASVLEHIDSDDWQKEGGAFVPHPTTYLNQGRWEDEVVSRQIEKKKARLHPALMA